MSMIMMVSRSGCAGCVPYAMSMYMMVSRPGRTGRAPYEYDGKWAGVHRMCTLLYEDDLSRPGCAGCAPYEYDGE